MHMVKRVSSRIVGHPDINLALRISPALSLVFINESDRWNPTSGGAKSNTKLANLP